MPRTAERPREKPLKSEQPGCYRAVFLLTPNLKLSRGLIRTNGTMQDPSTRPLIRASLNYHLRDPLPLRGGGRRP